ncbi:anaphase-promoting complex subunit 8 [Galdieria sulphuraria]|uniref:Anaphase-promoting complex subunit 8 n=1 Tax=Galdieria sulphuraria TaxID=130081 RepID=M2VY94_GALSU|nr:anaphase-promoting complex subunit 8 [Galdieria sulphuraria]EME28261.1 anaphase-promoting complex subunit 8 [Galdieria sulphuraria]|eukprot:XP_005704781.1 anaphase-promoting complex subunit 8 [Galdieria sulphuraria]
MSSKLQLKTQQLTQLCQEHLSSPQIVSSQLLKAIQQLTKRGLVYSARWCAELAFSLESKSQERTKVSINLYNENELEQKECTAFLLGRRYFDCREYRRCAECLKNLENETSVFLRCYSLFLASEKERLDSSIQSIKALQTRQLEPILSEICHFEKSQNGMLSGFLCYLCGIISRNLDRRKQAISFFIRAVVQFPFLFDAWKELSHLVSVEEEEESLNASLPQHWMTAVYYAMLFMERREYEDALQLLNVLLSYFPKNTFLLSQIAYLYYDRRDFDESALYYEEMRRNDPQCIDGMDIYSNILYVREQQAELSMLAHHCILVEKYRPETCTVVGNYYSLRGDHEKAVIYFERALKLNPHYVSALTLIGHEYVEMKNTSKAIEAYRKAVDIQPKDFRAWYGLGQAYELLRMPSYSLYYYRKAASLRPFDSRMWCAMGLCLEEFGKLQDALTCYERALKCEDREVVVFRRIAHLYDQMGDSEKAHSFYLKELELREEDGLDGSETAEALGCRKLLF